MTIDTRTGKPVAKGDKIDARYTTTFDPNHERYDRATRSVLPREPASPKTLGDRVAELEAQNAALKARVSALEQTRKG